MKLGFLTGFSEDIVKFAGDGPFGCLEISGPPEEWIGDTDEAHAAREKAKTLLDKNGLIIASFMIGWPSIRTTQSELKEQLGNLSLVMDVADHVTVLNFGVKITEGTPAEISNNPEVIEAYLGRKFSAAAS